MTATPTKDPLLGLDKELQEKLLSVDDSPEGIAVPPTEFLLRESRVSLLAQASDIDTIAAALRKLAKLAEKGDRLARASAREGAIQKLKVIGVQSPGKLVDAAFPEKPQLENSSTAGMSFMDPEPWEDPVPGDQLLREISEIFSDHLIISPHEAVAISLWIVLTYLVDHVSILPLLWFSSPEKRCGKSLALEILYCLVLRPLMGANISAAATYRVIEKYHPTLLIDEADTFLGKNEELRGVINSGHKKSGAFIIRCHGDNLEPTTFSTWCPKVLAGIGKIADTMEDRSIAIRMKRKAPGEHVKRFRAQKKAAELDILKRAMMRFATDNAEMIKNSDPAVPEQLHDRAQDNWRPLLAIAEAAGGEWPDLARAAALQITGVAHSDESVKVVLLKDIQSIFEKRETEQISSEDLCSNLHKMEDRPWSDWQNGKPITPRHVAKLLKPFDIQPEQHWIAGANVRGYRLEDFRDSLSRYGGSDPLVR